MTSALSVLRNFLKTYDHLSEDEDSSGSEDSMAEHPYVPLVTEEEGWSSRCRKMEQRFKIVNAQKGYLEELVRLRESQLKNMESESRKLKIQLQEVQSHNQQEKRELEAVVLELQEQLTSLIPCDSNRMTKGVSTPLEGLWTPLEPTQLQDHRDHLDHQDQQLFRRGCFPSTELLSVQISLESDEGAELQGGRAWSRTGEDGPSSSSRSLSLKSSEFLVHISTDTSPAVSPS